MMLSFKLGPLAISAELALLYLGLLCAWLTCWFLGRKRKAGPETPLFNLLLIGVLVARLAFVITYREFYYDGSWLAWLDIRDGGFLPLPGLIAALLAALWYFWRRPQLAMPLASGLVVGVVVSGMGLAVLHAMNQSQQLPQLDLRNLAGEPVNLQDYQGKPVVINLWATWCPPCRREMPVLQQAQLDNPAVHFVFVNQGEGQHQVSSYIRKQDLHLENVLLDSGARLGTAVSSLSLPTTLFYDAGGSLQNTHLGELSEASLQHAMRNIQPNLAKE